MLITERLPKTESLANNRTLAENRSAAKLATESFCAQKQLLLEVTFTGEILVTIYGAENPVNIANTILEKL